ncbi:GlxA family transcriptional regulator [Paralysiella testudinis]|uniref:Helix-turn-helix domain-containing protein n=1 Tax=Paralysiella testudinis TaxID=2809020 RepID=A0A892ZKK2_9NEIS|nr:helix-turn-helix domain-containing protein [Paralysiella testudinis]QRQ81419.1 helix-turn-helix domain-containing protein [Paralysiella testudinis]
MPKHPSAPPVVALLLYPDFSLFHIAVPYMVFSTDLDGRKLFDLRMVQWQKTPNPLAQIKADGGLELLEHADIIIMPGWTDLNEPPTQSLINALNQADQNGKTIVGLCFGTYALAYAGLLNGKRAATHWAGEADFRAKFPHIALDINLLYVEDGNIITSAGTAAAMDCCLAIVRNIYGIKTANKLARLFVSAPHREGGQAQFIEQPLPRKTAHENMNQLLDYLRENLTRPHHIDDLAKQLSMSRSTFTRHFRHATGLSFARWLIEIRLQKGRDLLESTDSSIEEIAEKCGFASSTLFRQQFKNKHQISPTQWRKCFTSEPYSRHV